MSDTWEEKLREEVRRNSEEVMCVFASQKHFIGRKRKMRFLSVLLTIFIMTALFAGCTSPESAKIETSAETESPSSQNQSNKPEDIPSEVMVPVLMFHDVKSVPGGTWSMSAENFRNTIIFLKENGYTPVSFDELIDYVDGKGSIPPKPVCITLDDGYYSNFKTVLPIAEELKAPVTVFMTCKTVRENGVFPSTDENLLEKMNAAEIGIVDASPYGQVQSHTYGLHGMNHSYGDIEREYSLPVEGETEADFKEIFSKDCSIAEKVLTDAGVETVNVLSYPGGRYHEWTETVLRERGYRASVTSDYEHRNLVSVGDTESLFMLGRMNVNDDTTHEQLLTYLERK